MSPMICSEAGLPDYESDEMIFNATATTNTLRVEGNNVTHLVPSSFDNTLFESECSSLPMLRPV